MRRSLLQFHFQRIVVAFANIVAAVADAAVLRKGAQQLVLSDRGLPEYSLRNERIERIGHLLIQKAASQVAARANRIGGRLGKHRVREAD